MAGITPETKRIATLSSGKSRGSNLLAIYRYFELRELPVQIALAVFTDGASPACQSCRELQIPTRVISARDMKSFEQAFADLIFDIEPDLIALCGFMRLLSSDLLARIKVPVLNIHPALLPKYGGKGMYGMAVHEAVAAGERISGATIHTVDPIYDHGNIIAQKEVDISACKSPADIAHNVLKIEHEIYAKAIYHELFKA